MARPVLASFDILGTRSLKAIASFQGERHVQICRPLVTSCAIHLGLDLETPSFNRSKVPGSWLCLIALYSPNMAAQAIPSAVAGKTKLSPNICLRYFEHRYWCFHWPFSIIKCYYPSYPFTNPVVMKLPMMDSIGSGITHHILS